MWVPGCLVEVEDGCYAGVGAGEDLGPVVTLVRSEVLRQDLGQLGPGLSVHLGGEVRVGEAEALKEQCIELRLDRADRDVTAVAALVGPVEGRTTVEEVRLPAARRSEEHTSELQSLMRISY